MRFLRSDCPLVRQIAEMAGNGEIDQQLMALLFANIDMAAKSGNDRAAMFMEKVRNSRHPPNQCSALACPPAACLLCTALLRVLLRPQLFALWVGSDPVSSSLAQSCHTADSCVLPAHPSRLHDLIDKPYCRWPDPCACNEVLRAAGGAAEGCGQLLWRGVQLSACGRRRQLDRRGCYDRTD